MKAQHPNIHERIEEEIAALEKEVVAQHGKKGNTERRQQLEALKEKANDYRRKRWAMKNNMAAPWGAEGFGTQTPVQEWRKRCNHKKLRREQIKTAAAQNIVRDEYGALLISDSHAMYHWYPRYPWPKHIQSWINAVETYSRAKYNKLLPQQDSNFDQRGRGWSVNHAMYAHTRDGDLVIVRVREFERKKYSRLTLRYFITDGETAHEVENGAKSLIKRAATQDNSNNATPDVSLRAIFKHLPKEWQDRVAGGIEDTSYSFSPSSTGQRWASGYKLLGELPDGTVVSLYDGKTTWKVGEEKRDVTKKDHGGGLYFYHSKSLAENLRWQPWPNAEYIGIVKHVLFSVRARGRMLSYGEKIAASRMILDECVASWPA